MFSGDVDNIMNILIILNKHKLTWKNSLCYEISHWQKFAYVANGIYINHIQHKLLYSIADFSHTMRVMVMKDYNQMQMISHIVLGDWKYL